MTPPQASGRQESESGAQELRTAIIGLLGFAAAEEQMLLGGKSTLLNLIAGLDRPAGGTVTVAGERIDRPPLTTRPLPASFCLQVPEGTP